MRDTPRLKASRLRTLRLREGHELTQEALARKAGVALRTVIRIEQGESSPQADTAFRLAAALKVGVTELFEEEPA